jgi:hypothetical protein
MTSTKNHVWFNVHFPRDVHAALKAWCHRNGRSMQDGLVEMVALSSGPNGLRLAQPVAAPPPVRAAASVRTPDPPAPKRKPVPTRDDAKRGMITTQDWDVPGDWLNGEGIRRDEGYDSPGEDYYVPPPIDASDTNDTIQ